MCRVERRARARVRALVAAGALAGQRAPRRSAASLLLWLQEAAPSGPGTASRRRPAPQRAWLRRWGLGRGPVPQVAEAASAGGGLLGGGAGGAHELLWRRGRGAAGVLGQPRGEVATLLDVVCAQDAGDVRVVFGVAVGFAVEEVAAQRVVAGGGVCEQVGEVGRHGSGGCGPRGRREGFEYRWLGSGVVLWK